MNQLNVVSMNGQLVTDSREVAKMVGRRHSDLMRTIGSYEQTLTNAKVRSLDFFIINSYRDAKGELRNCYLLTRKGCDMVANKMTGDKGVLFTAAYVTKFEEMENKQPKVLTEREQLVASMKLSIETAEEVNGIREDVNLLKNTMRIDGAQEHKLQRTGKAKVLKALGGKNAPAYKELSRSVFQTFWNEFKNHFMIPRYNELPKKSFDDALNFIGVWHPDTSTRLKIESLNRQITIDEDSTTGN